MATSVDYGYVNARIRGMKSRLLGPELLESLILKPDTDAIITELEKTSYRAEIEKASVQHAGLACIEVALRTDIARVFRKIYSLFEEEKDEKYARILLNRWDVHNIKTILRGKNIHEPSSEILGCLIPAGELDEATLVELVKQPDVRGVIDLLATWRIVYALPLTQQFKDYSEKRDLAIMEYALDKFYFENALESLQGQTYDDPIGAEDDPGPDSRRGGAGFPDPGWCPPGREETRPARQGRDHQGCLETAGGFAV
jgi:V/A-type H+-transporting ATPase subunit C